MSEASINTTAEIPVETTLRDELARGDTILGTVPPILGHLVASSDHSLFSDEIVAHVRGMATSVASQLLMVQAKEAAEEDRQGFVEHHSEQLVAELLRKLEFLSHFHALTIECQLSDRLQRRNAIDPVLSPLLQALIASDDANVSSNAMAAMTAQARFVQQQRRMEIPLKELPGDLFHEAVLTWRAYAGESAEDVTGRAEMDVRAEFDEGTGRLGLLSKLVAGMGNGAMAALSVSHAGVGVFLTALAMGSSQDRDIAALSTNERLLGRLALGLRAAGLKPKDIEEQFFHIHPDIALPDGFDMLRADRAAEMLASSDELG